MDWIHAAHDKDQRIAKDVQATGHGLMKALS